MLMQLLVRMDSPAPAITSISVRTAREPSLRVANLSSALVNRMFQPVHNSSAISPNLRHPLSEWSKISVDEFIFHRN